MRINQVIFSLAFVALLVTSAAAYLATPTEIRQFWERQRLLRNNLYLRYESTDEPPQILEIFIRPDGLWAKRVHLNGVTQRETWKWGLDSWQLREQTWKKNPRKQASWEDWLFEPKIDVLLNLTPSETMDIRGLGLHREGQLWLYGARSQNETSAWFGLLRDNIRLGTWNSIKDDIGLIDFFYHDSERYPAQIIFQRQNRPPYQLIRRALVWNPGNDRGFQKPSLIEFDAKRQPARPLQHADPAAHR